MAGVALLSEVDHLCNGGCDTVPDDGRSGTVWSKASTAATATSAAARQGADAAKGHFEVVRPIMKEKASKAVVVAGTAARQGMEAATEGLDVMRQGMEAATEGLIETAPIVRQHVSTAAVAAGSVARHHVEVAKDQLDTVRQSRPAMRGKASAAAAGAVAKQRLDVAKGHLEVVRHSGLVIRSRASNAVAATGTAARHSVDAAKERVDTAKDFLVSVRYPGLAPGQSVNACEPGQDVDDSGRLIAMAFARHHLLGMEAEDAEAAAEFLRSQRTPTTRAGAARLRVKASFKKVRSSLRSTKRRMTTFIKRAASHKNAQKQRAAQRAAANASSSQRLMRSDFLETPTTQSEVVVAPPDVFELFSNEELALQQALPESVESGEWGATPDARQPTTVDFFPIETASVVPVESDVPAPEVACESVVSRAWFLQPSAGTWLLPVPHTLQDRSAAAPSVEVLSSPEVLASKIATPTGASLVQLRSCGGA